MHETIPITASSRSAWQQRGLALGLRFVNDWAVLLGTVVLFDFGRSLIHGLIGQLGLRVYLGYVIDWEHWLCAGHIGPVLLQQWRDSLAMPELLDTFFVALHASLFIGFLAFGVALWSTRREGFRQYATGMAVLMLLGLPFYLFAPTVPPWLAANEFRAIPSVERIAATIYASETPSLTAAFDVNPFTAMPSLHSAFPAFAAFLALQQFGYLGVPVVLYAVTMCVAIVYLGENYVIAVIAGICLAAAVFALVRRPARDAIGPDDIKSHRLAFACALVVAAFAVEQMAIALRHPLPITPGFVATELRGRSDKADLYLGRIAYAQGNWVDAQQHLRQALGELATANDRREAQTLLAVSAFRVRDYHTTIATLEGRAQRPEDHGEIMLLASAYIEGGDYDKGMALFSLDRARFPHDPEPLYWITRYAFLHGRVDADRVRATADELASLASPQSAPLRLALQQLIQAQPPAESVTDVQTIPFVRAAAVQR